MIERNLLIVVALAAVAPASAHPLTNGAQHRSGGCPLERARTTAAWASARSSERRVVIIRGTPAQASLIDGPATLLP